jgi:hypothetical protein
MWQEGVLCTRYACAGTQLWVKLRGMCHWPVVMWSMELCMKKDVPQLLTSFKEGVPLPLITHPITTSCFQQHCIIRCLLHIPEMHMMYTLSSNGTAQVMQTEFEFSRACLHCMHDLLIALCRACSGAFRSR